MAHHKTRSGIQAATLFAGVILLLIVFVSVGYFFVLPGDSFTEQRDPQLVELDENRMNWQRVRPDAYEYVVARRCDCPRDYTEAYRVTTLQGQTSFRYEGDYRRELSARPRVPPQPVDIDGLFTIIEEARGDGASVQVFFDADFGFPAYVRITPEKDSAVAESGYEVRSFGTLLGR